MKISVITVCYNSELTIRDTLESVLSQTYKNVEYIVIDGGSKDSTLSIITEYSKYLSKFVSEPDNGIYDAINKGIKLATGDLVGILNSDDVFYDKHSLQYLCKFLETKDTSSLQAIYADLIYVKRDDLSKKTRLYRLNNFLLKNIRFGFMIPHPTFYAKPALFKKYGGYKDSYRVAADFELMLRFKKAGVNFIRHPKVLVKMREGGISSTGLWWIAHQNFEIVRACKENGMYTNIFLILLKLPAKLISRVFLK